MMRIRGLKQAGYPFGKNDLTMEEWEDMGRLEELFKDNKTPAPVYLVRPKK